VVTLAVKALPQSHTYNAASSGSIVGESVKGARSGDGDRRIMSITAPRPLVRITRLGAAQTGPATTSSSLIVTVRKKR
jgi:hypothetical protein